jgi:hypothetical protein
MRVIFDLISSTGDGGCGFGLVEPVLSSALDSTSFISTSFTLDFDILLDQVEVVKMLKVELTRLGLIM